VQLPVVAGADAVAQPDNIAAGWDLPFVQVVCDLVEAPAGDVPLGHLADHRGHLGIQCESVALAVDLHRHVPERDLPAGVLPGVPQRFPGPASDGRRAGGLPGVPGSGGTASHQAIVQLIAAAREPDLDEEIEYGYRREQEDPELRARAPGCRVTPASGADGTASFARREAARRTRAARSCGRPVQTLRPSCAQPGDKGWNRGEILPAGRLLPA
jgi:hypothetical protein